MSPLGRDSEEGTQACRSPRRPPSLVEAFLPPLARRGPPLWAPALVPWPSGLPSGSTLRRPRTPTLPASHSLQPGLLTCASVLRAGQARGQAGAGGEACPRHETGLAPDVAGALHSPKAGTFDLCNTTARGLPGADCTLGLLGGWFWAAGRLTGWGLSPPALTALLAACMHSRARGPLPGLRCCCPHQAPLQTASGPSSATPPCTSASCLSPGLAWAAGARGPRSPSQDSTPH